MRDDHDFTKTQTKRRYVEGAHTSTVTVVRKVKRSRRSDSQPTLPLPDGSYGRSTSYEAFFATSSEVPGQAEWRVHQWPYNGVWRTTRDAWDGWSSYSTWYHGCSATGLVPAVPAELVSRARSAIIGQIRNTNLNLAVTIGEIRDSYRTVLQILRVIAGGLKQLRGLRDPQQLASAYLSYIYGVRPLMSDIYGVCETLVNGLNAPIGRAFVDFEDDTFSLPTDANPSKVWYEGTVKRGIKISYTYTVRDPLMFQLWQLGLTNPLALAWELTTLSFVVDWFTGIGRFFAALDTSLAVSVVDGYETRYVDNTFTRFERMYDLPVPNRVVVTNPGVAESQVRTKSMQRSRLNSVAVPLPYLDVGLNLNQMMSAIALIVAGGSPRR